MDNNEVKIIVLIIDVVKVMFILLNIIVNGFWFIELFVFNNDGFVYGIIVLIIVIDKI